MHELVRLKQALFFTPPQTVLVQLSPLVFPFPGAPPSPHPFLLCPIESPAVPPGLRGKLLFRRLRGYNLLLRRLRGFLLLRRLRGYLLLRRLRFFLVLRGVAAEGLRDAV
jgi:hypothetical protein